MRKTKIKNKAILSKPNGKEKKQGHYLVVGLGNPGAEHERTRHNAGRRAVAMLALRGDFEPWREDRALRALRVAGEFRGARVTLLLPQQFMNRSGTSVAPLIKSARAAERLIIAYDDLDLPLGVVKISFGRSSGGHKGLESVIRALKTRDFTRVRIGIAPLGARGKLRKPRGEQAVLDFLLGAFGKREEEVLVEALKRGCEAIETIIAEGRERAMSICNASTI